MLPLRLPMFYWAIMLTLWADDQSITLALQ